MEDSERQVRRRVNGGLGETGEAKDPTVFAAEKLGLASSNDMFREERSLLSCREAQAKFETLGMFTTK